MMHYLNKVIIWFEGLAEREKLMLSIALVFVGLTLFYLLLIEPTQNRLTRAKAGYINAQELHVFMLDTKDKVTRLSSRATSSVAQPVAADNLLAYLDSSMRQFAIDKQLNSISPGRQGGANLRFDNVAYEKLMQWLSRLVFQNGITIVSLSVTPTASSGMVKANIAME